MVALGIDIYRFFDDFSIPKPSHVAWKMYPKIDLILKRRKNRKILQNQSSFIKK